MANRSKAKILSNSEDNQQGINSYQVDDFRDQSQIEIDNSVSLIKAVDFGFNGQEQDFDNSQIHDVTINNQFPGSCKSQQNQSFVMNNSVLQLNSRGISEERGSLNSGNIKNQNSAKTNVYTNNTSIVLNGSKIDDNNLKSPSHKKNNKIGNKVQQYADTNEQSYEINIGHQLLNGVTDQQNQHQHKKPTHLPPIKRVDKNTQNGISQTRNQVKQDHSHTAFQNNNQNRVIVKTQDLIPKNQDLSNQLALEIDQKNIGLEFINKGDIKPQIANELSNKSQLQQNKKKKQRPPCIQTIFPKCKLRSSVTAICCLFIVFFIIQLILEGANKQNRACAAYKIGCQFQPTVQHEGEVHRLLISSLLHASWFHLVSTVFTLLFYGFLLEEHFGVAKMVILYIVCAFTGNVFEGLIDPYELQIGPNSIIMGIFILQGVFLFTIYKRIPKSKKKPILGMFLLLVITNFLCIIESLTVKASSYLGGIVAGLFLSFAYYKAQNPSKRLIYAQKASYIILAIIILGVFIGGMTSNLQEMQISVMDRCSS